MINHIVCWNLLNTFSAEEKKEAAKKMKKQLEAVAEHVTGVISLEVKINELSSSNRDIALISVFESVEALNAYQVHPAHAKAAEFVSTVACDRTCFDYEL